jgi:predicted nucleotidyltransferase
MSLIATALFPKTKRGVLALLFGHPGREFHIREVARSHGLAVPQTRRELQKLESAGLLVRRESGQMILYRANEASPIYDELRRIVMKVLGIGPVLARALAPLAGGIDCAFVYGSVARGEDTSESDIDLMVIGEVTFSQVAAAVRSAQDRLERPVNPTVYPRAEWAEKVGNGHHFIATVSKEEKLYIIGSDDVLEELRGERLDSAPRDVEG